MQKSYLIWGIHHSVMLLKCIFGVLKWQWQILGGKGCEYSIDIQVDLFYALIGLYNFEKDYGEDYIFNEAILLLKVKIKMITWRFWL
jgi:hypothetical protein